MNGLRANYKTVGSSRHYLLVSFVVVAVLICYNLLFLLTERNFLSNFKLDFGYQHTQCAYKKEKDNYNIQSLGHDSSGGLGATGRRSIALASKSPMHMCACLEQRQPQSKRADCTAE